MLHYKSSIAVQYDVIMLSETVVNPEHMDLLMTDAKGNVPYKLTGLSVF